MRCYLYFYHHEYEISLLRVSLQVTAWPDAAHLPDIIIYNPPHPLPHVKCCSEFPRFLPQRVMCPGIGVTIARIICQPDRDPQITCSTHYYPEFRHPDIKVFHNIQLPSVLAQLAAESTFIPPQLARLKIAIYRNKIQYKELDTKQRCNKTRTMTQSIDSTPSKVTRTALSSY